MDNVPAVSRAKVTSLVPIRLVLSTPGEKWFWHKFRDACRSWWSWPGDNAFAEQVEVGSAIHLALDHFDAVDGAFHGAGLHGWVSPAVTASRSASRPVAKPRISGNVLAEA